MGVQGTPQVGCRLMALLQGTRGSSEGQGLAALKAHKEGQDGRRKMADFSASVPLDVGTSLPHTSPPTPDPAT